MLLPLFAAFAFLLSGEKQSSTPVTEPAHTAWRPWIASDGRDYLVEWTDTRGLARAAKVTIDGTVAPRNGTRLPRNGAPYWDGSHYVIYTGTTDGSLESTFLDRDGDVLGMTTQPGTLNPGFATVSGSHILTVRIDPGGQPFWIASVVDANQQTIRTMMLPRHFDPLALGSNGGELVILGRAEDGTLALIRLSFDGNFLNDSPSVLGSAANGEYAIVSDGDGFLVVRVDVGLSAPPHQAHLMALSAAGLPRGGVTTVVLPDGRSIGQWDVVWSGAAWIFGCSAAPDSSVWSTAVGRNAEVLIPLAEIAAHGAEQVALGTNGSSSLLVWATRPNGVIADMMMTPGVMTGQFFDAAGASHGTAFPVTWSAAPQQRQEVAWDGRELLAVWSEGPGLFAGRLTVNGTPIDGRGMQVASTEGDALPFDAAFDGETFVVTWQEGGTVFARRITPDGSLAETMILGSSDYPGIPAIRCDGAGGCFITWTDSFATRGVLLRGASPAAVVGLPSTGLDVVPTIAFDGREYVVAIATAVYPPQPCTRHCQQPVGSNVQLFRVSTGGMMIDPIPVTVAPGLPLSVEWGGETGLLVWRGDDLSAAVIGSDLHAGPPFEIGSIYNDDVHVAFDGEAFLVSSIGTYIFNPGRVRLTIVSPGARAGESALLEPGDTAARVAGMGKGRALLSYLHRDGDGVSRAFTRVVTDLGDVGVRPRPARH